MELPIQELRTKAVYMILLAAVFACFTFSGYTYLRGEVERDTLDAKISVFKLDAEKDRRKVDLMMLNYQRSTDEKLAVVTTDIRWIREAIEKL